MKWTKERKIYGGLLALGVLALVVDRLSGGPKEAAAQEDAAALVAPNVAGKSAPPKTSRTADTAMLARADLGLAERLRAATNGQPVSDKSVVDVFRPSRKWAGDAGGGGAAHPMSEAERFKAAHRLTAVMMSGRSSRAIVDGTPLRLGESLDGFKLLSVDPGRAVLERSGARVVLALDQMPVAHADR